MHILVLYDDRAVGTRFVAEHLEAFAAHSRHSIAYMPATRNVAKVDHIDRFDAVIIHFCVRLPFDALDRELAAPLTSFRGVKIAMPQDEYDLPHVVAGRLLDLGVDAVFTTVPEADRNVFYPADFVAGIEFHHCMTGYVGEDASIERFALPLSERSIAVAYRGRRLPVWYGALADEKAEIGIKMREACAARGIPCDIDVEEDARILGEGWYRFLGGARATLASESGSNVVDSVGLIRARCQWLEARFPDLSRDEIYDQAVRKFDGLVLMNQLTPKIFEAVRLRTALVLYEGKWSGVLEPWRHYIPLRKDWSNVDEVLKGVMDNDVVGPMTERAYTDLVASRRWSYATFVERVDEVLDRLTSARDRRAGAAPGAPELAAGVPRYAGEEWDGWPTPGLRPAPPVYSQPTRKPLLSGRARAVWLSLPAPVRKQVSTRLGSSVDHIANLLRRTGS